MDRSLIKRGGRVRYRHWLALGRGQSSIDIVQKVLRLARAADVHGKLLRDGSATPSLERIDQEKTISFSISLVVGTLSLASA